jgi:hypothetical protein
MRRSSRVISPPDTSYPDEPVPIARRRSFERNATEAAPPTLDAHPTASNTAAAASPPKRSRLMVICPLTILRAILLFLPTICCCAALLLVISHISSIRQLHVKSPAASSSPPPFQAKTAISAVAAPASSIVAVSAPQTPRLTKSLSFADQLTENDPSPALSPRYRSIRRVSSGGGVSSPRSRTAESFSQAVANAAAADDGDTALEATVTPRSNRRPSSALSVCTSSGGTDDNGACFSLLHFSFKTISPFTKKNLPYFLSPSQMPQAHRAPTAHRAAPSPCR